MGAGNKFCDDGETAVDFVVEFKACPVVENCDLVGVAVPASDKFGAIFE